MKKLLALLLALIMLLSFAACESGSTNDDDEDDKKSSASDSKKDDDEKDVFGDDEGFPEIEEVEVVDNEECIIRITGIEEDEIFGPSLNLYLENKSDDIVYSFSIEGSSINGVEASMYLYEDVQPGKKSNTTVHMYMMDYEGEDLDIGKFSDIALTFCVQESGDYTAEPVALETVHVYPYGEEEAFVYEYEADDDDMVLVDNEYATVIATDFIVPKDSFNGFVIALYMENKTDTELHLTSDEDSVNGYMIDSYFYQDIQPGNIALGYMTWDAETLEDNEIETVEEIEFLLSGMDYDAWEDFFEEEIALTIE